MKNSNKKIIGEKMKNRKNVFQLTLVSMMVALLIIQTFIPIFGYIPLGPIDVTIVHITVILSAVLFGKKFGTLIGTIWGLLSMLRAFIQPTPFNIVFLNPLVSILPRLLVGFISASVFQFFKDKFSKGITYTLTAGIGSLMNTILVLGSIYIFTSEAYANALGIPESALLGALGTIVATNGLIEIIAAIIILPILAIALEKFLKDRVDGF